MSYNRSPIPNDGTGTGTVTSVSVVTANGVSGSVATAGTTPAITLALGDITPTKVGTADTTDIETATALANAATDANTASTIVKRDGSGDFSAGTITAGDVEAGTVNIAENGLLSVISTGTAFKSSLAAPGGLAADVALTLPAVYGSPGDVMITTDALGTLDWSPPGVTQNTLNNTLSVLNSKQIADLVGLTNVTLSGIQTLDGSATSNAVIVLLNGQTDPTENGLWSVSDVGPWVRPTGWASGIALVPGSLISITSNAGGVAYSNTLWYGTGDGGTTALYQQVAVGLATNTGWGSITNVTPDKSYNANATTVDELADVLGTLIVQLIAQGILRT